MKLAASRWFNPTVERVLGCIEGTLLGLNFVASVICLMATGRQPFMFRILMLMSAT